MPQVFDGPLRNNHREDVLNFTKFSHIPAPPWAKWKKPEGCEMTMRKSGWAGWAMVAALMLAGCDGGTMVGRASDPSGLASGLFSGAAPMVAAQYHVTRVDVVVPRTLRVSEENVYVPIADIVWHGDALGDRYDQVRSIMAEAAQRGTAGMRQGASVVVQVEIERFHALTPKARYTFGGNFATRFILTVKDARTGAVLDGPRLVVADCPASGGQRAMEEEAAGITQRMVIVDHVSGVFQRELSRRTAPAAAEASVVSRNAFQPADLF